ncbi:MAG: hypothetical protein ACR2OY_08780, partial [Boseongicola sp.]
LYTRDVVPNNVVREVVEAVMIELDLLRQSHPALSDIEPESLATLAASVPSHNAAREVFAAEGLN